MSEIRSHEDLLVWQKAMDLTVAIYAAARPFPREETYGLRSQITRAAVSVPANIAEGHARGTRKDFSNFLAIAKGSLMELHTHTILAHRLNFITPEVSADLLKRIDEVSRMLAGLRKSLATPPA